MVSAAQVTKTSPNNGQFLFGQLDTYTVADDNWNSVGIIETWGFTQKRFKFQVTGHNANFRIYGYQDPTKTLSPILIASFTILAGDDHTVLLSSMYAAMDIQVHNAVNGQDPVIQVYYAGDRSEHTPVRAAMAHETVTATTGAGGIGLTRDTMDSALECLITVEANPVRFWLDGTAPTSSAGHLVASGDTIKLTNTIDMLNALFIGIGGSAVLSVTYFR